MQSHSQSITFKVATTNVHSFMVSVMGMFQQFMSRYPGLASIMRNGSWRAAQMLYLFAVRTVYVLAISRLLGPEGYGFFSYAQTFYLSFLPFVLLGMDALLPRDIGRRGADSLVLLQRIFTLRLSLSIAFTIVAALLGALLETQPDHQLIMLLISVALIPRSFQSYCSQVFVGYENVSQETRYAMGCRTLEVVAGVLLLWFFEAGVIELVLLHLFIWTFYALISCRAIHRQYVPLRLQWKRGMFASLFIGEQRWLAIQMLLHTLMLNAALLVFRHLNGDLDQYGQMALAMQVAILLVSALSSFAAVSDPVMARSYERGDGKDYRYAIASSILFFVLGWCVVGGLYLVGEALVLKLVGEAYALSASMIHQACYWLPFAIGGYPLVRFFFVRKRHGMITLSYAVSCLLLGLSMALYEPTPQTLIHSYWLGFTGFYTVILICFLFKQQESV